MAHTTLTVRSNIGTVSDVLIRDLGWVVPFGGGAGGTVSLTAHAAIENALLSEDLRTLATDQAFGAGPLDSTLILGNGTIEVPADDVDTLLDALENLVIISFDFNFTEAPFKTFGSLLNGDEIIDAEVEILTVFDDAATLLRLTLVTAAFDILESTNIDPLEVGVYHNGENKLLSASDQLRIVITPGISTQGAGRVNVLVRR